MEKEEGRRGAEREGGGEAGSIFRKSKMVQRSPVAEKKGEIDAIGEMIQKMGEGLREEIRGTSEQGRGIRKEVEELRKELKKGEERWREEKEILWEK